MNKMILGPVLADFNKIWSGHHAVLASAYYSAARLNATIMSTRSAELLVRLDLARADEWIARAVAPDALLAFIDRHAAVDIRMFCGPHAHVKAYLGDDSFFVGSANYTVRGLSGTANEVLWYESSAKATKKARRALVEYRKALKPLSRTDLERYVERYRDIVKKAQSGVQRSPEDSIPVHEPRPVRIGTYDGFLQWLGKQDRDAAAVVLARAHGEGNLSGHIRMNFFGIRQFMLAHPVHGNVLRVEDPDAYRLAKHVDLQKDLKDFVLHEATDEGGLKVSTWRTYLPEHSGGKPKSGGGTQGNLNRMLPLMAKYLKGVC